MQRFFGLAHLLGIDLMPRIRNWKDLTLFRPLRQSRNKHSPRDNSLALGRIIRAVAAWKGDYNEPPTT